MLVYAEGDELFTENSSCPWSEEGCAENVKKDDLPENAISELSENTESRSNNWPEQFQVFDGMLEDKVNRGEGDQGGKNCPLGVS